jgi:hypothetical protein
VKNTTGASNTAEITEEEAPGEFGKFPELAPAQLSALLIQKEIKRAKKFSYRLRNNLPAIRKMWFSGSSFCDIAERLGLLPMAVAYALRNDLRYTRKEFQYLLAQFSEKKVPQKPKETKMERVSWELGDACRRDWLHSPWALRYMKEKGQMGEAAADAYLHRHNLAHFLTEKQQDKNGKTPDFLFDKIEKFPGTEIPMKWFESKATFGTLAEVKEDNRSQLSFYNNLFGQGAIVYWLGLTKEAREFLTNANGEKMILVLSGEDLRNDVPEIFERLVSVGLGKPE